MSAPACDARRAVKAAGFDPTRAEAVAAAVGDATTGTVAAVADMAGPRVGMSRMKAELHRLVLVSSMAVVGPAAAPMRLVPQVRDL